MSKKCVKCGDEIHPMRVKILPNTKVCVECSNTGAYRAITTVNGEGDHTWNDIQLMTPEQYARYQQSENNSTPHSGGKAEYVDWDAEDDSNLQGPFIIEELKD